MFCTNCGHRNPEGSNFCSSCGTVLASGPDTTVAFVPVDPSGESGEYEVTVGVSELAGGGGVLVVKRGPDTGSKFPLDSEITRIGRHPDSDIFLDDITVSRRHAELARHGPSYTVKDVGSLNGTYVNRERIEEATLSNGDEVQIGKFKLVFLAANAS
ncbi:MAG TPA: FHA domain-containing protein [Acidimicrobiales bacterium]|nr:FHA domain-containing protein [Acidimicrobiales bacterium]